MSGQPSSPSETKNSRCHKPAYSVTSERQRAHPELPPRARIVDVEVNCVPPELRSTGRRRAGCIQEIVVPGCAIRMSNPCFDSSCIPRTGRRPSSTERTRPYAPWSPTRVTVFSTAGRPLRPSSRRTSMMEREPRSASGAMSSARRIHGS